MNGKQTNYLKRLLYLFCPCENDTVKMHAFSKFYPFDENICLVEVCFHAVNQLALENHPKLSDRFL